MKQLKELLHILVSKDGSDLYLTADSPPAAKFHGKLKAIGANKLDKEAIRAIAHHLMDDEQRAAFERKPEMNLALSEPGIGRFRVNIFRQRGALAMVIRNIKTEIPRADDLGLPPILKEIILEKRGLVMFVGATGSGKSTSLAALINHRNRRESGHIITIEDPIEFIHPHKKSIVSQREIGVDTDCYQDALENTLRQAPDVILIGEVRSRETMEYALTFAETGHLCLTTLHANNADQALDRIINFFPDERRNQLFMDLSLNLKAIVSQRLVPTRDGRRTAAIEILLGSPLVCDLIKKGEVHAIKAIMAKSEELGMQTFDSHLFRLYQDKVITLEEALRNADSPNNLKLRIKLGNDAGPSFGDGLSLASEIHSEDAEESEDEPAEEIGAPITTAAGGYPPPP